MYSCTACAAFAAAIALATIARTKVLVLPFITFSAVDTLFIVMPSCSKADLFSSIHCFFSAAVLRFFHSVCSFLYCTVAVAAAVSTFFVASTTLAWAAASFAFCSSCSFSAFLAFFVATIYAPITPTTEAIAIASRTYGFCFAIELKRACAAAAAFVTITPRPSAAVFIFIAAVAAAVCTDSMPNISALCFCKFT